MNQGHFQTLVKALDPLYPKKGGVAFGFRGLTKTLPPCLDPKLRNPAQKKCAKYVKL